MDGAHLVNLLEVNAVTAALLLLLCGEIEGPTDVDAGGKIVLRSDVAGIWGLGAVPEERYEVSEDRKSCYIWAPRPERIRVLLVCCDAETEPTKVIHHIVVGNAPQPGPMPLPDGKYKLAQFAKDTAKNCPTKHAATWAACYREVAAAVVSGKVRSKAALQKAQVDALRKAIPDDTERNTWRPFAVALATKLKSLEDADEMTTLQDYTTAWVEIATGLEAVR